MASTALTLVTLLLLENVQMNSFLAGAGITFAVLLVIYLSGPKYVQDANGEYVVEKTND